MVSTMLAYFGQMAVLSSDQAAAALGISPPTLLKLLKRVGGLEGTEVQLGKRKVWRIDREALQAYAAEHNLELKDLRTVEEKVADLTARVESLEAGLGTRPAGPDLGRESTLEELVVRLKASNDALQEHIDASTGRFTETIETMTARFNDELRERTNELLKANRELTEAVIQAAMPADASRVSGRSP